MVVITLQRNKCIGCNYCVEVAPAQFQMSKKDGKSVLLHSTEKKGFFTIKNNTVTERKLPFYEEFKNHQLVFHSPVVFVPRLNEEEIVKVADDICQRLQHTKDKAYFMIPKGGVGRYSYEGGVLEDKASDAAFA